MFILKKGHQSGVYVPLRALFLVFKWIFLILAGNKDTHKSLNELNFCEIQQLTIELVALECIKNQFFHFLAVAIDLILYKLTDKEGIHNI